MPKTKPFRSLLEGLTPEREARIRQFKKEFEDEMALYELREALQLTQTQLAKRLRMSQAAVSRLERRSDMFLSTLQKVLEGMGGNLEILAVFPAGTVRLTGFREFRRGTRADKAIAAHHPP